MKTPLRLFALLFLIPCCLPAQPAQPQNILFIFDASGSMWGKLENSTKIQVAKETMTELSGKIKASSRVGLLAYGHNSAADCNDIEILIPLEVFDPVKFQAKLKSLNPKGKTPIAKSIRKALEVIQEMEDPVTIILVSDGLETCEGNACEIVKEAKAAGIKITMHVVGFGITEKDLSPLECVAQAGGGQYFPADNAGELADALEKTVTELPAGDAFLSVKTMLEGKLTDATVQVTRKGDPKDIAHGRTYTHPETNPRLLQLPSGTYDVLVESVTIQSRPAVKFENVVVNAGDTLRKEVTFDQGIVEVLVTRNGQLSDATVRLVTSGTNSAVTSTRSYKGKETNPVKLKVPPGRYDLIIGSVEISGKPEKKFSAIELVSGGNQRFEYNFESGELRIGARQGAQLVDATISIVHTGTGKSVAAGRTYQSADSNPKTFILEPGSYRVDLNAVKPADLGKKSVTVEITAKGSIEKTVEW